MAQAGFSVDRTKLSYIDDDVVAVDRYQIASDVHVLVVEILAGGDVILPSMPRATHDGAVDFAFAERAAAMLTLAVECIELSANMKQRQLLAVGVDRLAGSF